jgi:hypothetical protein
MVKSYNTHVKRYIHEMWEYIQHECIKGVHSLILPWSDKGGGLFRNSTYVSSIS